VDRPLIVGAIVLQFHDPVETLGTVALTQELVVELHRLCNMRELVPVDSRPEPWHDGVHHLAAPSFVSNFATRESKPFSAAIITFEISPGVQGHEGAASRERSGQFQRPFGAELGFPVHESSLFGPGISHLQDGATQVLVQFVNPTVGIITVGRISFRRPSIA
jgi:hypothetical protein